jgi:hypothetical protein
VLRDIWKKTKPEREEETFFPEPKSFSLSLFPFLLQQALRSRKKGSVFLFYFPQNTQ